MMSLQLQGKVRELHQMVVGESQLVGTVVPKSFRAGLVGPPLV
jgi:hypothetical protein